MIVEAEATTKAGFPLKAFFAWNDKWGGANDKSCGFGRILAANRD